MEEPIDLPHVTQQAAWLDFVRRAPELTNHPFHDDMTAWLESGGADQYAPQPGWPSAAEPVVAAALVAALDDVADHMDAEAFTEGPWVHVFSTAVMLNRTHMGANETLELWSVKKLRQPRSPRFFATDGLLLFATLRATAQAHNHGFGWHLHPYHGGTQLSYRLFFDSRRTQDDLAWERHGNRGALPYGDPATVTLSRPDAARLHTESLRAVSRSARLAPRGTRFRAWASHFGAPDTRKAHIAHPAPATPTRW